MRSDLILENLEKLNSTHIAVRNEAVDFIHNIKSVEEIIFLFKHIKAKPNDDQIYTLLITCENILESSTSKATRHCVYILIYFYSCSQGKIRDLSKKIAVDFFKNNVIIDQIKILSLSYSWKRSSDKEKRLIVEFIKDFKFGSLASLLIDITKSKDEELIIKSLNTIIYFKETRANRFIRTTLALNDNSRLFLKCLEAIGHVGSYIDLISVKKFLSSSHKETQRMAINSISNLAPNICLLYFKNIYFNLTKDLKIHLLHVVSDLNSINALNFLLEVHAKDYHNLLAHLEWSIYNLSTKKKLKIIMRHYDKSKDVVFKYHLLNLMGDFHDTRCSDQYNHILKTESNSILRNAALENLGQYNNFPNINFLKNLFLTDKELSLTAYHSLLRLSKSLLLVTLAYYIEDKSLHKKSHNLLTLSYIKNRATLKMDGVIDFIITMLKSDDIEIKLLAIDSCQIHHSKEIYEILIGFSQDDNIHISTQSTMSLLQIVDSFAYYLSHKEIRSTEIHLLSKIDYFNSSYHLLTHVIRLEELTQNKELSSILRKNSRILAIRLNSLIHVNQITQLDQLHLVSFMLMNELKIDPKNISFIKKELYFHLDKEYQPVFLNQILDQELVDEFDFLVEEYFLLDTNIINHNQLANYLENIL